MITKRTIEELNWILIEHPPYSPDVAASDFYLFYHLQHYLSGAKFNSKQEVINEVESFLNSRPPGFYREGIYKTIERWQMVEKSNGDYFDHN